MARGSCSADGVCVAVGPAPGRADGQKGQERRAWDERAQRLCLHGGSALSFLAGCSGAIRPSGSSYAPWPMNMCVYGHFRKPCRGKGRARKRKGRSRQPGRLRVIVPAQRPVVRAHAVGARSEVPCGFPGLAPPEQVWERSLPPAVRGLFWRRVSEDREHMKYASGSPNKFRLSSRACHNAATKNR